MQSCQSMSSFGSRIPGLLGICESWWVTGILGVGNPQVISYLRKILVALSLLAQVFLLPKHFEKKNGPLRYLQTYSSKNRTIHLSQQKKDPSIPNPKTTLRPPQKSTSYMNHEILLGVNSGDAYD